MWMGEGRGEGVKRGEGRGEGRRRGKRGGEKEGHTTRVLPEEVSHRILVVIVAFHVPII